MQEGKRSSSLSHKGTSGTVTDWKERQRPEERAPERLLAEIL